MLAYIIPSSNSDYHSVLSFARTVRQWNILPKRLSGWTLLDYNTCCGYCTAYCSVGSRALIPWGAKWCHSSIIQHFHFQAEFHTCCFLSSPTRLVVELTIISARSWHHHLRRCHHFSWCSICQKENHQYDRLGWIKDADSSVSNCL